MIIWEKGWQEGYGVAEAASGRWCEVAALKLGEFNEADAVTYKEAAERVREKTKAKWRAGVYREGVTLGYALAFALDFEHLRDDDD